MQQLLIYMQLNPTIMRVRFGSKAVIQIYWQGGVYKSLQCIYLGTGVCGIFSINRNNKGFWSVQF